MNTYVRSWKNRIKDALNSDRPAEVSAGSACRSFRALLFSLISTLLALTVLVTSTVAWFTARHNASAVGEGIDSGQAGVAAMSPYTLYVRQMSGADRTPGGYTVYTGAQAAVLNDYDAVMGRNDYTAAYLRVPVSGVRDGDDLTFTVDANGTLGSGAAADPYLSNFLNISCVGIPASAVAPDADPETVYGGAAGFFSAADPETKTFVTEDGGIRVKNSVSFTLSDIAAEDGGVYYVYFRLDYDDDLINDYLSVLTRQDGGFYSASGGELSGYLSETQFDLGEIRLEVSS